MLINLFPPKIIIIHIANLIYIYNLYLVTIGTTILQIQ